MFPPASSPGHPILDGRDTDHHSSKLFQFSKLETRSDTNARTGSKPITVYDCVSSNQKTGKNSSCARIAMLSASFSIPAERSAGRSPYRLNRNSRVRKNPIHEICATAGYSEQLGENGRGHDQASAAESCFDGRLRRQIPATDLAPNTRQPHWRREQLSLLATHFTRPAVDGLSSGPNSGSANATIFSKHTLVAHRSDTHTFGVALE